MAKGGFRGGHGGGFSGGMNMNAMKKMQQMQQDMMKMQAELEEKEFSATAGGGMVKAVVTGKRVLKSLEIDPEALTPEDADMVCDTIIAAVNEALRQAEGAMNEVMSKFTGGLDLGF
jgi:DNA-binding YbaB/EbfC family protein